MTESPASRPSTSHLMMLVWFGVMQVAAFGICVYVVSTQYRLNRPWQIAAVFGTILAQCSLVAAIAVFSPWGFIKRMLGSAIAVAVGGLVLIGATEPPGRVEDLFLFTFFALLLWALIQLPMWLSRLLLRANTVMDSNGDVNAIRTQYGIRQLMGLTLAVSLILGLGRMVLPAQALEELKNIRAVDWMFFCSIAVAASLITTTTIMTTLNPYYRRLGLVVPAISAVLLAYGVYSVAAMLSPGPANERLLFAMMIFVSYAWLQLSVLLVRAAGYRIVVRA